MTYYGIIIKKSQHETHKYEALNFWKDAKKRYERYKIILKIISIRGEGGRGQREREIKYRASIPPAV